MKQPNKNLNNFSKNLMTQIKNQENNKHIMTQIKQKYASTAR
jgi:hypothetical protein